MIKSKLFKLTCENSDGKDKCYYSCWCTSWDCKNGTFIFNFKVGINELDDFNKWLQANPEIKLIRGKIR